jgi:4-carboxymuconolactone decarboxylase
VLELARGRPPLASGEPENTMDKPMYDKGLAIRKAVLGAEYVDKSLASADDFNRPIQEMATQYCWGEVWGREGLDRKWRSVLNIGMLVALNRRDELKLHIRGALNNGLTVEEIRELLLQTSIYCGLPASLDAFRVAREVLNERAAAE